MIKTGQLWRSRTQPTLLVEINSVPRSESAVQVYGLIIRESYDNKHYRSESFVTKSGLLDFFTLEGNANDPDWEV